MIPAADLGTMLDGYSVFYTEKLVADHHGVEVTSLEQSRGDEIRELAGPRAGPPPKWPWRCCTGRGTRR